MAGDTRGNLWLFDYQTGAILSVVKSHPDRITGLTFKEEDGTIIACSKDSFLNVFTLLHGENRLAK